MSEVRDRWASGASYEQFMGRWSRRLAVRFVSWLGIPEGAHWLDVGCGTGALTSAICGLANPASVVGCDPAQALIDHAGRTSHDRRASFAVAGVGGLPARAGGYGSVTSLLALNLFPNAAAAVHEMRSLTNLDGTVSACVWDYAGKMEFLRFFWDAAARLDPVACALDEGERFPLCRRVVLEELFGAEGLRDVRCEPIEIPTTFSGFDDYWRPFLGATGPAPSYVASLTADRSAMLARELDRSLPRAPDGAIALTARAFAVRGTVSETVPLPRTSRPR